MAELINQILALPRAKQLALVAQIIAHLQEEESEEIASVIIPEWQFKLAEQSMTAVKAGTDSSLSEEVFWKEVDAHIESLE